MPAKAEPYTPRIGDWVTVTLKGRTRTGEVIGHDGERPGRIRVELYAGGIAIEIVSVRPWQCAYVGAQAPIGVL